MQKSVKQIQCWRDEVHSCTNRLGLTKSAKREKLTAKEFISWTRNRDPRSIGWEYHPEDDLYHPLQQ